MRSALSTTETMITGYAVRGQTSATLSTSCLKENTKSKNIASIIVTALKGARAASYTRLWTRNTDTKNKGGTKISLLFFFCVGGMFRFKTSL